MYESHFGFHRQPFQCAELSRAFFVSESIRAILPQLLHALRSDLGIAVLTGPAGVGKSSLLRYLQTLLSNDGRSIICSGASLETPTDVLLTLQTAAQLKTGENAPAVPVDGQSLPTRWTVVEQMRKTTEFCGPVLLLIDDAQLLPVHILNELRAFTEEEWNGRGLVRILTSGPLSLEEELARPTYSDFGRRIRCHAFLQPLTTKESMVFLSRHLEAAGGRLQDVFSSGALELIASACDGLPRCLSLLTDESLVVAAELSRKSADEDCVRKALTRLQHLPYSWNASPIRSDANSFDLDDNEYSSGSATTTSGHSAVTGHSAGVIEFGAPGVIEFGATPAGPVMTSTDPVMTPTVVESVETRETDWFASPVPPVVEFGTVETGDRSRHNAAVEVNSFSEEQEEDHVDVFQSHVLDVTERWFHRIAGEGFLNRMPVFDRYTWIALGREVPSGCDVVSSTLQMQQVGDRCASPDEMQKFGVSQPLPAVTFDSIPVTPASDHEIISMLSGNSVGDERGTFFMFRSPPAAIPCVEDAWSDEGQEDWLPVDASKPETTSESPWHDGQLIFSSAVQNPELVFPVAESLRETGTTPESEQVSISFGSARMSRVEHTQSTTGTYSSEPKREKFFTLPVEVSSIAWELRSELADLDGVLPLAESLASFRDEVTLFQQTGRNIFHNETEADTEAYTDTDTDAGNAIANDAGATDILLSPEATMMGDSLVSRAKSRLEDMAVLQSSGAHVTVERCAVSPLIDCAIQSLTADELNSNAAHPNNTSPKFSQLFTRLRQVRRRTAENDCR